MAREGHDVRPHALSGVLARLVWLSLAPLLLLSLLLTLLLLLHAVQRVQLRIKLIQRLSQRRGLCLIKRTGIGLSGRLRCRLLSRFRSFLRG